MARHHALLVLFVPNTLFWATYEQMGNTIVLWIDSNVDRTIDLFGMDRADPDDVVPRLQSVHDLRLYAVRHHVLETAGGARRRAIDNYKDVARLLRRHGGQSHQGLCGLSGRNAARRAGCGCSAQFVVITVGELYLSPVGLSFVTKVAPARILSMMMGVWLATSFTGGFLAGWLGSFWSRMQPTQFFLMIAAIATLAGVLIFACRWPLRGLVRE